MDERPAKRRSFFILAPCGKKGDMSQKFNIQQIDQLHGQSYLFGTQPYIINFCEVLDKFAQAE